MSVRVVINRNITKFKTELEFKDQNLELIYPEYNIKKLNNFINEENSFSIPIYLFPIELFHVDKKLTVKIKFRNEVLIGELSFIGIERFSIRNIKVNIERIENEIKENFLIFFFKYTKQKYENYDIVFDLFDYELEIIEKFYIDNEELIKFIVKEY